MTEANIKHMIMLNRTGDVCISWDEDSDTEMLTFIQKKINDGYIFFILENSFFNLKKRKKYISSVNDINDKREVYLDDNDAEKLYKDKKITLAKVDDEHLSHIKTVRKAKQASEVLKNNTIATRPMRGG